jgi:pilus assembly protein CpaB
MKQQRTFVVMSVAVVVAGLAAVGVRQAIARMPVREVEVASVPVVVAAKAVPVGTRLTADHLKVVAWPARTPVAGAFTEPTELVNRGVIVPIGEHEPVTASKVAGPEAGAGLPPIIPDGMRAISVRVNEVVGVAGFVLPGTRVDVLVAVRDDGDDAKREPMARTVVSNVQVLTAGTRYDQEQAKDGKPMKSTVVTLAVTPADGERLTLASTEGEIALVLRNPTDVAPTDTTGVKLVNLMRGGLPTPEPPRAAVRRVVVNRTVVTPAAAAPEASTPPQVYRVEAIRAAKRTEEAVH